MASSSSPRYLAWRILNQVETKNEWAEDLFAGSNFKQSLNSLDQRLCRELVLGILKHKAFLDYQLQQLFNKPKMPHVKQLNLFRIGLYQLCFLDKVPDHAAVNEVVEIAKQQFSKPVAGFINAGLRRFIREGERALPGKNEEPVTYCQIKYSFPRFIVEEWISQFGLNQAEAMMQAANEVAPLILRVNLLKTTREALMQELQQAGIECRPGRLAMTVRITQLQPDIKQWPGFEEGHFYFQDTASQMIGLIANPKADEQWLDLCAAPGGKTTHLAEIMRDQGKVFAYDISAGKRKRILENSRRLGLKSIEVIDHPEKVEQVDGVLVDAPCSGLGTLRRHAETKWRLTENDSKRLAGQQVNLLTLAASRLKPGGTLVYSTCTTMPSENEEVVKKFMSLHPQFELQDESGLIKDIDKACWDSQHLFRTYPHYPDLDGMFAVKWKKTR